MANTKLDSFEKIQLREMRKNQTKPEIHIFQYPEHGITIGIRKTGQFMGQLAVSICSPGEDKFRKKVGEYNVRASFPNGQYIPVAIDGRQLEDIADEMAFNIDH